MNNETNDVLTAKDRYDSCFYRVSYDKEDNLLVLTSVSGTITKIELGDRLPTKTCMIRTSSSGTEKIAVPESSAIKVKSVFVNGIKNYINDSFTVDCNVLTFSYTLPIHSVIEVEYQIETRSHAVLAQSEGVSSFMNLSLSKSA